MNSLISFWLFFFWLSILLFYINCTTFLNILFVSELVWVVLYCLSVIVSTFIDDASLLSISFFLFALAGLEFALGFILLVVFKYQNISLNFNDTESTSLLNIKQSKLYSRLKL